MVSRTVQVGVGSPTSGYFIYDGNQMTLALDENGDVEHRLLWGPAVDQILAEENGAGDVYWMLTDNQNTVRDVVEYDAGLDETNVVNHIAYDSFGNKLSETDDSLDMLDINYTGRYFDEATGLQWNLNRWYNPSVGRWMSEDPIGFGGGVNLMAYVSNQPILHTDPLGLVEASPNAFWIKTLLEYATYTRTMYIEHHGDIWGRAVGNQPEIKKITDDTLQAEIRKAIAQVPEKYPKNGITLVPFHGRLKPELMNGDGIAFWLGGAHSLTYSGTVKIYWDKGGDGCPYVDLAYAKSTWKWRDVIDGNDGNFDAFITANGGYGGMMRELARHPFQFGWQVILVGGVSALEDIVYAFQEVVNAGFNVTYEWEESESYDPWK
jgi:RHS repeat-associated protein